MRRRARATRRPSPRSRPRARPAAEADLVAQPRDVGDELLRIARAVAAARRCRAGPARPAARRRASITVAQRGGHARADVDRARHARVHERRERRRRRRRRAGSRASASPALVAGRARPRAAPARPTDTSRPGVLARPVEEEHPPPGELDASLPAPASTTVRARAWRRRRASPARSGVASSTQRVPARPSRTRRRCPASTARSPPAARERPHERERRRDPAQVLRRRPERARARRTRRGAAGAWADRATRVGGDRLEQVAPGASRPRGRIAGRLRATRVDLEPGSSSGASAWRPMKPLAPVTRTRLTGAKSG